MASTALPIALRGALTASLLLASSCTADPTGGSGAPGAAPAAASAAVSGPGSGPANERTIVVWESNRSGEFRIWRQDLPGGKPRQISAEEPGRDHCCAKLSPDGSRLVYLSLPGGARKYSPESGPLHLVDSDGGRDRVLVPEARHYGEHRAAVWWGEDELVYIAGDNATRRLRLSTGATSELAVPPAATTTGEGWLVAPGGGAATGNTPTFSDWTPARGVALRPSLGGCQPAFSNDGRYAVWSAGAGGPIDAIELATRRTWSVLEKGDPHLPAERGYSYFPMLSNDASLLAVGVSAGEHDHFRADYDIYVLELDPRTLLPSSRAAQAVAPHPAVDRFPDLYRAARPAAAAADGGSEPSAAETSTARAQAGVVNRRGLVFLWQGADAENRVAAGSASEVLEPQGLAWIDRHRALALGGGSFSASGETARRLNAGLVAKHQMTLSLLVTPASLRERGPIAAFSDGSRARNFVLRQEGGQVVLVLRTSDSAKEGLAVPVARLAAVAPTHLLLTFSPGRLTAFVDGRNPRDAEPLAAPGDLFHWRPRTLQFGAEASSQERWHGTVAEVGIWNRPLTAPEITAEAARVRAVVEARPAAPRLELELRLLASSPAPALEEISPYREALVVDELEVVRQLSGPPVGAPRIRVARWAILAGQVLAAPRVGEVARLVVEPFSAQPQLEPYFLADRLPADAGLPLYFDLGATASARASAAP